MQPQAPPPPQPPAPGPPQPPADPARFEQPIAPQFGAGSLLFVLVLLALQYALAPTSANLVWEPTTPRVGLWLGTMWAGVSAAVWMLASAPLRVDRMLLLAAAIFWHGWWMHDRVETPLERYVISMGAFGLLQATLGHLAAVPGWRLGAGDDGQRGPVRRRFGIASLLVVTTLAAVVLAASRRYDAPDGFLIGTAVSALALAVVAVTGQLAMTAARGGGFWALAMLGSIVAAVAVLSALSAALDHVPAGAVPWWASGYGWKFLPVFLTFAALVTGVATCGRLDYELHRLRR